VRSKRLTSNNEGVTLMCYFVIFVTMNSPAPASLTISLPYGALYERRLSPRYYWDNSLRGEDDFVIIQKTLSGTGSFTWEGRSWPVPEGHAFIALVPEHSSYGFPSEGRQAWTFSWLNFAGSLATQLCRDLRLHFGPTLPLPTKSTAGQTFEALIRQARGRAYSDPWDVSQRCYSFLIEWARQLAEPLASARDPAEMAARICQTRFRERIGVKELAWESGVSREHLTRLFTERHGVSPAQYLRRLRTEEARRMLTTLGLPLNEAALRCGFPSPRALSRALAGS
jgi:AraC-like DNA-binding protein